MKPNTRNQKDGSQTKSPEGAKNKEPQLKVGAEVSAKAKSYDHAKAKRVNKEAATTKHHSGAKDVDRKIHHFGMLEVFEPTVKHEVLKPVVSSNKKDAAVAVTKEPASQPKEEEKVEIPVVNITAEPKPRNMVVSSKMEFKTVKPKVGKLYSERVWRDSVKKNSKARILKTYPHLLFPPVPEDYVVKRLPLVVNKLKYNNEIGFIPKLKLHINQLYDLIQNQHLVSGEAFLHHGVHVRDVFKHIGKYGEWERKNLAKRYAEIKSLVKYTHQQSPKLVLLYSYDRKKDKLIKNDRIYADKRLDWNRNQIILKLNASRKMRAAKVLKRFFREVVVKPIDIEVFQTQVNPVRNCMSPLYGAAHFVMKRMREATCYHVDVDRAVIRSNQVTSHRVYGSRVTTEYSHRLGDATSLQNTSGYTAIVKVKTRRRYLTVLLAELAGMKLNDHTFNLAMQILEQSFPLKEFSKVNQITEISYRANACTFVIQYKEELTVQASERTSKNTKAKLPEMDFPLRASK